MSLTVSAPGKLMLLGEHAVVYGRPCLVTAVSRRMRITATLLKENIFELEASNLHINDYKKPLKDIGSGDIPKGAKFVESAVKNFIDKYPFVGGIHLETISEFSTQFGFGSSSAVSVCTIKALDELLKTNLSQKEIFDLAYKTVLDVQGKGSGFDIAAAAFGGTLYFTTGGKAIEPLDNVDFTLVVGYSGVKADTVTMVNLVKSKMADYRQAIEKIFDSIAKLVEEGKLAILEKDWLRLGKLMNYNQDYLEDLGVSTEKLDSMISAARKSGAFGAKLSGAGGGDCMIALVPLDKKNDVSLAIEKVGGQVINIVPHAPGVKIES